MSVTGSEADVILTSAFGQKRTLESITRKVLVRRDVSVFYLQALFEKLDLIYE